jgi:hypothetical protein
MIPAQHMAKHRQHTRRDFERGLAGSLLGIILLFLFFPISPVPADRVIPDRAVIEEADLMAPPQTLQSRPPRPPLLPVIIPGNVNDQVLADLPLTTPLQATAAADGFGSAQSDASALSGSFSSPPRQVLEVLPESGDGLCSGSVTLSISIGRDGVPLHHRILRNDVDSEECLQRVIEAVYASRWAAMDDHDTRQKMTVRKTWKFK